MKSFEDGYDIINKKIEELLKEKKGNDDDRGYYTFQKMRKEGSAERYRDVKRFIVE